MYLSRIRKISFRLTSITFTIRTTLPLHNSVRSFSSLYANSTMTLPENNNKVTYSPDVLLDPSKFSQEIPVVALSVNAANTNFLMKKFRGLTADAPRYKPVVKPEGEESDLRYIVLHQAFRLEDGKLVGDNEQELGRVNIAIAELKEAIAQGKAPGGNVEIDFHPYVMKLGYENMSSDEILRQVIPPPPNGTTADIQNGFEIVGHVAHMNIRDEFTPYKYVIGKVILDKNPTIKCVVNKTAAIDSVFRTFPMEVIAGVDDTLVEVRHSGARFKFDFRKVYWNTRLQYEHNLMVKQLIAEKGVVADMFCGVGPFAVPLAMREKDCEVYANDLNPASYEYLVENVRRNKVQHNVKCYNMDGRAFIAKICKEKMPFQHVLMNLPADAIVFCDIFVGLFMHGSEYPEKVDLQQFSDRPLPRIHVYCFSKADNEIEAADDVITRILGVLRLPSPSNVSEDGNKDLIHPFVDYGTSRVFGNYNPPVVPTEESLTKVVTPLIQTLRGESSNEADNDSERDNNSKGAAYSGILPDLLIRMVRNVAPKKTMMCVSYTLPLAVAAAKPLYDFEELMALEGTSTLPTPPPRHHPRPSTLLDDVVPESKRLKQNPVESMAK